MNITCCHTSPAIFSDLLFITAPPLSLPDLATGSGHQAGTSVDQDVMKCDTNHQDRTNGGHDTANSIPSGMKVNEIKAVQEEARGKTYMHTEYLPRAAVFAFLIAKSHLEYSKESDIYNGDQSLIYGRLGG